MLGADTNGFDVEGIPTDGLATALTRRSMQARRSSDAHRRSLSGSMSFPPGRRSGERLMHDYDLENGQKFGLTGLDEDDEEEVGSADSGRKRTSFDGMNGHGIQKPGRSRTIEADDMKAMGIRDGKRRS